MQVKLIVAVSEDGFIGKDNEIPWYLKDDQKNFKNETMGHFIVFGRLTWEGVGRPLQGREIIVLSNTVEGLDGVQIARSLEEALAIVQSAEKEAKRVDPNAEEKILFVAGGEEVYRKAFELGIVDEIIFTEVHVRIREGDAKFPSWVRTNWIEGTSAYQSANERNEHAFTTTRFYKGAERQ